MKVIQFTLLCLLVSTMVYGQDKTIGISTLTDAPIQGTNAKRYVLIVGNAQYRGRIDALPVCINDADSMTTVMVRFGFSPTVAKNLDHIELRNTILNFIATLPPGSEVIIYWSGHGLHIGQRDYMIPVDYVSVCNDPNIENKAISLQWILEQLAPRKVKSAAFFLDACRNINIGCESECFGSSFNDAQLPENIAVFMGSSNCKSSFFPANLVNSYFTGGLLHALKIPQLSLGDLYEVASKITNELAKIDSKEQSPVLHWKGIGMIINNLPIKRITGTTQSKCLTITDCDSYYRETGVFKRVYGKDTISLGSARDGASENALVKMGERMGKDFISTTSSIRTLVTDNDQASEQFRRSVATLSNSNFSISTFSKVCEEQVGKDYYYTIQVPKAIIDSEAKRRILSAIPKNASNSQRRKLETLVENYFANHQQNTGKECQN